MKSLLVLSLLTTSVYAATSGTLLLQGIVPKKISVTIYPNISASGLDMSVSQTNLIVASINEKSNSKTGYKVTFTSANLGKLKRVDGPEVFNYTMRYDGLNVGLTSPTVFTNNGSVLVNANKDIDISYTGIINESMIEGTYSDVITLNIAAN